MQRRNFIALFGSTALVWPLAARAQQPAKIMPRIGYLIGGTVDSSAPIIDVFRQRLRQLGYIEGQNITIEFAEAHGPVERFPNLAAQLVRRNIDLIVAPNPPAARAAREATTSIPIVGYALGDPVGDGLVSSLARPGGNVTGLTFLGPELTGKRLQLLKDTLPALSRVAVLWHPGAFGERTTAEMFKTTDAAAAALRLHLVKFGISTPEEIDGAFAAMIR